MSFLFILDTCGFLYDLDISVGFVPTSCHMSYKFS